MGDISAAACIFIFYIISNRSIWPIDWTLTGTTTPSQSGPGCNSSERVLHIPQNSETGASSSDVA